ncbi:hypothetical protein [Cohnella sp.]|uniref:hypothetical protein n=1 Tax=Cohnella sp. TaxID=1883426 RepID=UPI00356906D3
MDTAQDSSLSSSDIRFRWMGSITSELSLCRLKDREITSRPAKVLMMKIGLRGCRFQTYMNIPVREDAEWLMKQQIGSYTALLNGIIVSSDQDAGWWTYEMRWKMSSFAQQTFEYRLNAYMQALLVNSPHIMTLYRSISQRNDGEFRRLDVST